MLDFKAKARLKTHWLFGRGPDKLLDFKREVDEETNCSKCLHREVCDRDMERRCENYVFGTSEGKACQTCLHKYTRYDKDAVPCFSCPWFEEGTVRSRPMMAKIDRYLSLADQVFQIAESAAEAETKYDLIFSEELSRELRDIFQLDYYDPDASYEEDVAAYVVALREKCSELQKIGADR